MVARGADPSRLYSSSYKEKQRRSNSHSCRRRRPITYQFPLDCTRQHDYLLYLTTPTHTIFLVENLLLMTVRLSDFEVYTPVRLGYIRCLHQFFLVQFCENVIITFLPRLVQ